MGDQHRVESRQCLQRGGIRMQPLRAHGAGRRAAVAPDRIGEYPVTVHLDQHCRMAVPGHRQRFSATRPVRPVGCPPPAPSERRESISNNTCRLASASIASSLTRDAARGCGRRRRDSSASGGRRRVLPWDRRPAKRVRPARPAGANHPRPEKPSRPRIGLPTSRTAATAPGPAEFGRALRCAPPAPR